MRHCHLVLSGVSCSLYDRLYDTQILTVLRSFAWGISSVSGELIISPCSVHGDLQSGGAHMSELLVFVLVAFVIGFVCGLIYALRLYKRIEAGSDREWAKRRGMPEVTMQSGELPVRINPILRRRIL